MTDPAPSRPAASKRRKGWYAVLAILVVWVFVLNFVLPRRRPELPTAVLDPAPRISAFAEPWTLESLDGRPVEFASFRGRAVFLNLWATWCPPCVDELPSIANLAADPRLKDFTFACVSVDGDPEELRRFLASHKLSFPAYHASSLPAAFQGEGIPRTYLIAPDGTLTATRLGSARWDAPEIVELLEGLARKRTTTP